MKKRVKTLQSLVFLGGISGFYETAEIVKDINDKNPTYRIEGILNDDTKLHGKIIGGVKVLGPLDMVSNFKDAQFIMGIGSYRTRIIRYEIIQRLNIPQERYVTLIHPSARIYPSSRVGHGGIIHSGVVIFQETILENFVTILPNGVIGTNNFIGEGALMAPLVTTTPHVRIGFYTHLGASSSIAEFVKIG